MVAQVKAILPAASSADLPMSAVHMQEKSAKAVVAQKATEGSNKNAFR
jgi:hypothetical protein